MVTGFFSKISLIKLSVLISIGLVLEGVFLLINQLCGLNLDNSMVAYIYGAAMIFVGWVWGNHITFSYRRNSGNYNGALPIDVLDKKLSFRSPCVAAGLTILAIGTIIDFLFIVVI